MESERGVSLSRVGDDEEQNVVASEKLAVSSNAPSLCMKLYHVADISKIVSPMSPAQGEDNPSGTYTGTHF